MNDALNAAPPPPVVQPASGKSVAALVLGLIGLFTSCTLLSPFAWYLGWSELRDIREGFSPPAGRDFAMVGMVLGIIGTALLVLALLAILFVGGLVLFGLGIEAFGH